MCHLCVLRRWGLPRLPPRSPLVLDDSPSGRAERMLIASLNPVQRETYLREGYFDLLSSGGRPWRIMANGITFNTRELVTGERVCAHLCDPCMPLADHLLAEALMLRTDEARFLRVANRYGDDVFFVMDEDNILRHLRRRL